MKILSFLSDFLGAPASRQPRARPTQRPQQRPPRERQLRSQPPALNVRSGAELAVDKALSRFDFIGRQLGLTLWPAAAPRTDWQHDLSRMLEARDLKSVTLEVLAADRSVLFADAITFGGEAQRTGIDSAGGIELPLLRAPAASHRLVAQRLGRNAPPVVALRLNWGDAETLPLQPGDRIRSEHAAKISGGRQSGEMHVSAAAARRELIITQTGARDYAFAREVNGPLEGIFLHARFAAPGHRFAIGQRLTAVLIAAPRGVQGRAIRPA